ncbi:unnamed protein product [Toxocara canis]|uniref:Inner membrane protein n=1 Tax=Toxocara canis TaxID=6265 RepID=A0A183VFI6_TOXCA|nr:unnamed protein product [Toxocara canis]
MAHDCWVCWQTPERLARTASENRNCEDDLNSYSPGRAVLLSLFADTLLMLSFIRFVRS